MTSTDRNSAFAGFGQSRVFRHDEVPLGVLAIEACHSAIADAGLDPSQIDGVACVPKPPFAIEGSSQDGYHFVSTDYVIQALGLRTKWNRNVEGMLGTSVVEAIRAIEAGLCTYALVFRALHSPSQGYGHTSEDYATGPSQYSSPYGIYAPARLAGQAWTRYQDRYKAGTREQMAAYVIQARQSGLNYEGSYWHQQQASELSRGDYITARMVATPLSIYDCDLPVQVVGAFVLTTAGRARDLPHPPAYVRGIGLSTDAPLLDLRTFSLESQMEVARNIGANLWAGSGLKATDVKVANLYDGFSFLSIPWLEGLGFCGEGEAFDFIQSGRIALNGDLPVNPSGGSLGSGRFHGINHLMDAVLQIMNRSGARQVTNPDIALATIGPPYLDGAAFLLGRDPN